MTFNLIHRRNFIESAGLGLGSMALGRLLQQESSASEAALQAIAPRAKHVIFLMQSGGPSHVDLFEDKPDLRRMQGKDLPASVLNGVRQTTMTSGQGAKLCMPAEWGGKRRGECGMWVSDLLPEIASIADDLCFVRSVHTDQINHAPAMTQLLTGNAVPGRPSMGAWLTYGLGSENEDLPSFVVMTSQDQEATCGQLFFDYYWGSGFLPGKYQGVTFRPSGDPILYLSNPNGIPRSLRRRTLDHLAQLNQMSLERGFDHNTQTRIQQYEMAFRMQASVPELVDRSNEDAATLALYGEDVKRSGSFASNCLMARRLVERGTRFVQLMHAGWDQHNNLPTQLPVQCRDTDRASAGLVKDLKRLGLLDDTLVIWGGEFGRTPFIQGDIDNKTAHGRDHHAKAFTIWMAGGGVKPGYIHGLTDEFGFHVAKDPVHIRDLQATILHLCGLDHDRLTVRHQGLDMKLTGVEPASVVRDILS